MLGEGRRVLTRNADVLSGESGVITTKLPEGFSHQWEVRLDEFGYLIPFKTVELIELGGKHAGLRHPDTDIPTSYRHVAKDQIFDAANYGRHADGDPRYDEELEAWGDARV